MGKFKPIKVVIKNSPRKEKKKMAIFYDKEGKTRKVHFGAKGYSDYTIHKDPERKQRYLNRHRTTEDWNKPMTAGSLSRYILWGEPTLTASINKYKSKFNLH